MDAAFAAARPAFGMSEGPLAIVDVSVSAAVGSDEVVLLVGSCKALGNWEVDRALVLQQSSLNRWVASDVRLPCGYTVTFRVVVACKHTRNPLRWEAGRPRSVTLSAESSQLDAEFGVPGHGVPDMWIDSGLVSNRHELLLTLSPDKPVDLQPAAQHATHLLFSSLDPLSEAVRLSLPLDRSQPLVSVWARSADSLGFRVHLMAGDQLLAGAVVLPAELSEKFGTLSRPLLNADFQVLGSVAGTFVAVHPFVHPRNTLAHARPMDPAVPRVVGHRGTGVSGADKPAPSRILENTVTAFNVAAKKGLRYVEFDVQPTRDGVPVIYHDFWIEYNKRAALVCEMTLAEFRTLHLLGAGTAAPQPTPLTPPAKPRSYSAVRRRPTVEEFIRETTPGRSVPPATPAPAPAPPAVTAAVTASAAAPSSPLSPMTHGKLDVREAHKAKKPITFKPHNPLAVREPYPTLQQLYTRVDPRLGFNVEVKYPDGHLTRKRLRTYAERNAFLDQVLQVTFDYAGKRPLYFSSFDPEVVWLLRRKQARYPVFFLTEGTAISKRIDPRSHSLAAAVRFAAEAKFTGVVTDIRALLQHPEQVAEAHARGLRIATYGQGNNDPATCDKQLELGVDVIIADKVSQVLKHVTERLAAGAASLAPAVA